MSFDNPKPGPGALGEYLASGIPYVTSSALAATTIREIKFPFVTKFFSLKNNSAAASTMSIAFSAGGLNAVKSNYFTLTNGQSCTFDLRVKSLFFSGTQGVPTIELVAGLTRIPEYMFPTLTGSINGSSSFDGVG